MTVARDLAVARIELQRDYVLRSRLRLRDYSLLITVVAQTFQFRIKRNCSLTTEDEYNRPLRV